MLIKPGTKRRRTHAEIAQEKSAEELNRNVARENDQTIRELTRELERAKRHQNEGETYRDVVEELVRQGFIEGDEDNNFKVVQRDENGVNIID